MNITLHIERLIIDQALLGTGRRDALHAAVEAELTRLLTEGNLPAAWRNGGTVPSLPGGAIQVGQRDNTAHLGAQIGQSVYGAIDSTSNRSVR